MYGRYCFHLSFRPGPQQNNTRMTLVLQFGHEEMCRADMLRSFRRSNNKSHFLLSSLLCSSHGRGSGVREQKAGKERKKINGGPGREARLQATS